MVRLKCIQCMIRRVTLRNRANAERNIEYVVEQELRMADANKYVKTIYCNHCKKDNSNEINCRSKKNNGNGNNPNSENSYYQPRKFNNYWSQQSPPSKIERQQRLVCHNSGKNDTMQMNADRVDRATEQKQQQSNNNRNQERPNRRE